MRLELQNIQLRLLHADHVARLNGRDLRSPGIHRTAQSPDIGTQCHDSTGRRRAIPHHLGQLTGRHRNVRMQQQRRQQDPEPRTGYC